jgi:hypothetical protein
MLLTVMRISDERVRLLLRLRPNRVETLRVLNTVAVALTPSQDLMDGNGTGM